MSARLTLWTWRCKHGHLHGRRRDAKACSARCACGLRMIGGGWCAGGHYAGPFSKLPG